MRFLLNCIVGVLGCIVPLQSVVAQSAAIDVRSNAPHFLRLGDRLELEFIIRNHTAAERTGKAELQLTDASTGTSIDGWFQNVFPNQYFTAAGSDSAVARFPIEVPYQFYKTAAWRFIVRTGNDTAVVQGRFPVLTPYPLQHAAMVINRYGSYPFTPLLQSKENEGVQHAGLQWQAAASPKPFAYAALPHLLHADAPPTLRTTYALFATALQVQLLRSNPGAARQLAKDLGWDQENNPLLNTALLQQRLKEQVTALVQSQHKSGAFSMWPAGPPDAWATQLVLINIGRLTQLQAQPGNLQETLFKCAGEALQYLRKSIKDDQSKLRLTYLQSFFSSPAIQASKATNLLSQIHKQDAAASAMTATWLWRKGDTALARKYSESLLTSTDRVERNNTNPLQHPAIEQSLLLEAAALTGRSAAAVDSLSRNLLAAKEAQGWSTPEATAAAVYALLLAYQQQPIETAPLISVQLGNLPHQSTMPNAILATQSIEAVRIHAALGNVNVRMMSGTAVWSLLQWRYFEVPDALPGNTLVSRQWTIVKDGQRTPLQDGAFIKAGEVVEVAVEIDAVEAMEHIKLQDEWPAGMSLVAFTTDTRSSINNKVSAETSAGSKTWWIQNLPKGKHRFTYQFKAMHPGTYSSGPAVLRNVYNQNEISRAEGIKITIE